jgi:hypothetical protein
MLSAKLSNISIYVLVITDMSTILALDVRVSWLGYIRLACHI